MASPCNTPSAVPSVEAEDSRACISIGSCVEVVYDDADGSFYSEMRFTLDVDSSQVDCEERLAFLLSRAILIFDGLLKLPQFRHFHVRIPIRGVLLMALIARNAVIEGDTTRVNSFAQTWLRLARPELWREAVEMVLLGDWVNTLGPGLADDRSLETRLRREAAIEHRRHQPVWERRVQGKRVALLEESIGVDMTLADLAIEHRTPETAVVDLEPGDGRLEAILRNLSPAQRHVVMAWAQSGVTSWPDAAWYAGAADPEAIAEKVRRKVRALVAEQKRRRAQIGDEPPPENEDTQS